MKGDVDLQSKQEVDKIWAGDRFGCLQWQGAGEPLEMSLQIWCKYFITLVKWNNRRDLYQKLINNNYSCVGVYQKLIQLINNSSTQVALYWDLQKCTCDLNTANWLVMTLMNITVNEFYIAHCERVRWLYWLWA